MRSFNHLNQFRFTWDSTDTADTPGFMIIYPLKDEYPILFFRFIVMHQTLTAEEITIQGLTYSQRADVLL